VKLDLIVIGQVGFIFLETTTLAMFIRCLASYLHCFTNLLSVAQSSDKHIGKAEHDMDMTRLNDHSVRGHAQETHCASQQAKMQLMEAFIIDVSRFSLVLGIEDESGICLPSLVLSYNHPNLCQIYLNNYFTYIGRVREFVLEVDVHLKFKLENMRRKFTFDLSRLSIFSQVFNDIVENEIQIPHFSSVTSNDMVSCSVSGDPAEGFQHRNEIHLVNEASCSRDPVPQKEFSVENCASEGMHLSDHNCILEQLGASMAVEKPEDGPLHLNQVWVGSGSVSGFDMTISLSEIQVSDA
jgi:hypothetical protein